MQSTNEELATVNEELQHRLDELGQLNGDLTNLLGGLNIPVILVNRELCIRRFTAQAESVFNLIPSDIGRPIGDLRPNLELPDFEAIIQEVIVKLVAKDLEVRDTRGQWHSVRIRPYVTPDNKVDGAAIAVVDIDAVKRSAEELKRSRDYAEAIVETVWEPLLVLDGELRVNRANSAFYRFFEEKREGVEGRSFFEISGAQWDQPGVRVALGEVLPANSRVRDLELEIEHPTLGHRAMLLSAHRIFWEGTGTQMVLVALEDVTARKSQQEHVTQLAAEQAARAEAEADNRRKDEFLAMLAHELRNPLAPVRNTIHILHQRAGKDDVALRALEISERQIGNMTRILDDLLDLARITRGKIQLRTEIVEVQSVVKRALEACTPQIQARTHELSTSLPQAPLFLEADAARLEQVLCNLLLNAAKYTPPRGRIGVAVAEKDTWVEISVSDDGSGIDGDMLPRVFDLFAQAKR